MSHHAECFNFDCVCDEAFGFSKTAHELEEIYDHETDQQKKIKRSAPTRKARFVHSVSTTALLSGKTAEKLNEITSGKPDPFQFFEVEHAQCHLLKVRVVRGRNISRGRWKDMVDTPDPYVIVHIRAAPDGRKTTRHVDNDANPVWEEEFTFLLPSCEKTRIIAEIHLMDSNYSVDESYGSIEFNVSSVLLEERIFKTFFFKETSEVDIEFYKEIKSSTDLRSSLALCDEEKQFRSKRKKNAHIAMKRLLEEEEKNAVGPRVLREVPVIAVIGSGGGFRAMTGFSGAIKALHDTGVLDCCTYVSGLSGSSWYLATLYANDSFPNKGPDETNLNIRSSIQNSPFWLLKPECLIRYSQRLHAKMKSGQPVTFVDFFGMMVGQTLLGPEKMDKAKLSDFRRKIEHGAAPMPLLTCLHVRPTTSAMTFHDWVEFTPYEVGMAKYGTFMKTQHFGSKFFMGSLAKQFDESPLHFLMGLWGSAFSILFNRMVEKSKGLIKCERRPPDLRKELEEKLRETMTEDKLAEDDLSESEVDSEDEDDDELLDANEEKASPLKVAEPRSSIFSSLWAWGTSASEEKVEQSSEKKFKSGKRKSGKGFLRSIVGGMFGKDILESREYRAGKILNYMRGVSLSTTYPLSPFTPVLRNTIAEDGEFQQLHEPIEVNRKRVHMVDAGLTFNSPYPAMLRPQRAVDLIISFDFSRRPEEVCEPFKEILLAEKWARMHHLPFPHIDRSVYDKEGMKECYVFKDNSNDRAPTIIHFVLCNIQFRKFSAPGVQRKPGDTSGDFDIFSSHNSPYSTFNFQYSNEAFDKLHKLMEFNTLLHIDTIIEEIIGCIKVRRHSQTRGSIALKDIKKSAHLSAKNKESLKNIILNSGKDGKVLFIP